MKPGLGLALLVLAGAAFYLSQLDRRSAAALHAVELDGVLPIPLYGILGALGVVVLGVGLLRRVMRPEERITGGPVRRDRGGARPVLPGMGLRDRVQAMAGNLDLPAGCRVLIDERPGVPLTLVLDSVPSGRGRRAVELFGRMVAELPTPPRMGVIYRACPPSSGPRHTEVQGALSTHLPRGSFRVTSHVDRVDVVFLQPDPPWGTEW